MSKIKKISFVKKLEDNVIEKNVLGDLFGEKLYVEGNLSGGRKKGNQFLLSLDNVKIYKGDTLISEISHIHISVSRNQYSKTYKKDRAKGNFERFFSYGLKIKYNCEVVGYKKTFEFNKDKSNLQKVFNFDTYGLKMLAIK